jgi:ABC-type amino acid transport substrate-binding protein
VQLLRRSWLRRAGAAFLFLFTLANASGSASAQSPEAIPDLAGIVARKELRVALYGADSVPFFYVRDGVLEGTEIDLAKAIGRELGVTVIFDRSASTYNGVVERVAAGKADVGISLLSRTLQRARLVQYTQPYVVFKHAMLFNRLAFAELAHGRDASSVIREFHGTIGVTQGTSYAEFVRRNFPQAEVRELPTWDDIVAELRARKLVAGYADETDIKRTLYNGPSDTLIMRAVLFDDMNDYIAMAVPLSSPHLLSFLNIYLSDRVGLITGTTMMQRYDAVVRGRSKNK